MPLTPQFDIRQDDTQVYVTIWVPTVRLDAMEVVLEQQEDEETSRDNNYNTSQPNVLHFYAAPYLLKLNFAPHAFLDDNHQEAEAISAAQYDPASQKVTVPLIKAIPGVHWENLELTARLLQPTQISKQWLHAVVRNDDDDDDDKVEEEDDTNNDTPKNKTEATTTASSSTEKNQCCDGYGYGGIFQNIFTDYCRGGLAAEMLQLSDPETTPANTRRELRQSREEQDFDAERYMGDFDLSSSDDYMYPMVLEFQPFWNSDKDSLTIQMEQLSVDNDSQSNTAPIFTSEERLQLATIPYPLLPSHLKHNIDDTSFWPQLLDLLIPYVYDHLTTLGDSTVESAWTISTLSCSLSWLDVPTCVEDVIFQTSRRMLIYPYWRNLDFVVDRVLAQTLQLLEAGSHAIIKAFLQIRSILEQSESYYVGNKIFVDPILYVIQQRPSTSTPSKVLQAFSQTFQKGVPYIKARLHLDLESIERMYLQGEEEVVSDATSTSSSSDDDDDDEDTDSSKGEEDTTADAGTDDTFERPPLLLDSLVGSADQTVSSSILLLDQQTNTSNTTTTQTSSGASANIAAESTARPKTMIEIMEST